MEKNTWYQNLLGIESAGRDGRVPRGTTRMGDEVGFVTLHIPVQSRGSEVKVRQDENLRSEEEQAMKEFWYCHTDYVQ